jgi:hypothetical protein
MIKSLKETIANLVNTYDLNEQDIRLAFEKAVMENIDAYLGSKKDFKIHYEREDGNYMTFRDAEFKLVTMDINLMFKSRGVYYFMGILQKHIYELNPDKYKLELSLIYKSNKNKRKKSFYGNYCSSCQESPCMCSDPEQTSNVYE